MNANLSYLALVSTAPVQTDVIEISRTYFRDTVFLFDVSSRPTSIIAQMATADLNAENFERLIRKLQDLPDPIGCTSATTGRLLVIPATSGEGFDILLMYTPRGITVDFGGLVQEFDSFAEALPWTRRALSGSHRLHTIKIGGAVREWRLEPIVAEANSNNTLAMGLPTWFKRLKSVEHQFRRNRFTSLLRS